ncbi:MAG: type II toxin-antitoxin system RelE/ParE family toxin [Chloroflexi bacterium]|nr:type II toxin-antitoxin system RelE/ParE family toxin [Chloroflexota bacterium]
MSPASAQVFEQLDAEPRARIRLGLLKLAADVSEPERIGGKSVKSIRGMADTFHRLRVGDHRIMYDVIDEDRVVLVLGIVHRADLERWLRNR